MLTTEWGTVRYPSCRDKGLVLVLVGVRPVCSTQSPLDRVATRTSTRPPPCPTSAPCPYRTGNAHSPIRSSKFIRGNALTPPPPGDHKGLVKIPRIFLALPHIIHPRPYGSSGLLPIFQAEVDAYWRPLRAPWRFHPGASSIHTSH